MDEVRELPVEELFLVRFGVENEARVERGGGGERSLNLRDESSLLRNDSREAGKRAQKAGERGADAGVGDGDRKTDRRKLLHRTTERDLLGWRSRPGHRRNRQIGGVHPSEVSLALRGVFDAAV